jgi:hypothetical protein
MSHLEFSIPGVAGGVVRIDFLDDAEAMRAEVVRGLKTATYMREKWLGTFPEAEADHTPPEHKREEPPQRAPAATGAVAFCPEHNNAPCQFNIARYNKDGDRMHHPIPEADWYMHEGRQVKNHNLYWRQTVNAAGESNDGKLIPQGRA